MKSFLNALYRFLCSLQLAVIVLLSLAFGTMAGTLIESAYNTKTAQYWVYQSLWFHGVLVLLALNLFFVMVSRWPWKTKHVAFLLAHIGIIILLLGSWVTQQWGIDGMLRVEEGTRGTVVEMDRNFLYFSERVAAGQTPQVWSVPVKWVPATSLFDSINVQVPGVTEKLTVSSFLPYADADFRFEADAQDPKAAPAVRVKLAGGPMRIEQDFWLWAGDLSTVQQQAGPAQLFLLTPKAPMMEMLIKGTPGPWFAVDVQANGSLQWKAKSSTGLVEGGVVKIGETITPKWKQVVLRVEEFIPRAKSTVRYLPSKMTKGQMIASPALELVAGDVANSKTRIWLGLGDRASLSVSGKEFDVAYLPQRVFLPFALKLDRFTINYYEGSRDPMSYESLVRVDGANAPADPIVIKMNQPLHFGGFTFYQSSYENADPRPTVSIFSVNRDPGRFWKYSGSLLLVLGIIWLFAQKLALRRKREAV